MDYDVFISYNSANLDIAEATCRAIESRGLRCFIAPRDIIDSDWAGNLSYAIEHSRAFVIIVSKESIDSREVAKEITLATRVSDYIFPLRIDEAELNGRMTYHLSAFHWVKAITPPMEKKINELADRVASALKNQTDNVDLDQFSGNRNKGMMRILTDNIAPRTDFIGRDALLEELDNTLSGSANAVFLTGMGGIGKSEIAKAYAQMQEEKYPAAAFVTFKSDLMHMIASDDDLPVANLRQASASGGQGETTEAYFKRKMNALRSILNKHTLLIIDNFDVEYDEHLDAVLRLPCKQIWTTRTDFSSIGYPSIKVGPLEDIDDLVTLMENIQQTHYSAEDRKAVCDIIRLLDRHTLAVSLTASQMKAGRIKPPKMLEKLHTEGLNIKTRSLFTHDARKQQSTAYGYIEALFDFYRLDEEACNIMRYMACMPREGVDIDLFMECCDIDDFGDIGHLAELNWIQLDDENDRISLHMLVRELVWNKLTPTEDNCAPMLHGAFRWAKNAWNKQHDENRLHSSIIYSLLEAFPSPEIKWLDCFEEMATFAWIMGRFDLSEKCEHHLYQLCAQHYGELSVQAGNQALRVAAVYHNQGDYAKARPWYEKGLEVQMAIDPESMDAWQARQKVARSNAQMGRFEDALDAFEKNLELAIRHRDNFTGCDDRLKVLRCVSASQKNLAQIYARAGRCEEALQLAIDAYEFSKTDTVEPSLVVYSLTTLLCVYQNMEDYEKAAEYARVALEENIRYHGKDRIDNVFLYETMGDMLAKQNRFNEAAENYTSALVNRERLFPADTAAIERLEEKIDSVQQHKVPAFSNTVFWT